MPFLLAPVIQKKFSQINVPFSVPNAVVATEPPTTKMNEKFWVNITGLKPTQKCTEVIKPLAIWLTAYNLAHSTGKNQKYRSITLLEKQKVPELL